MTATQVFIRFCKEYGLVSEYMPKLLFAYEQIHNILSEEYFRKKLGKANGKKYMLDAVLKMRNSSFSDTLYLLGVPNYQTSLLFNKFLREKVKGNYYKHFITDDKRQTDYGYRNGYHILDFSYKETAVW